MTINLNKDALLENLEPSHACATDVRCRFFFESLACRKSLRHGVGAIHVSCGTIVDATSLLEPPGFRVRVGSFPPFDRRPLLIGAYA